jgi:hypothetical protein
MIFARAPSYDDLLRCQGVPVTIFERATDLQPALYFRAWRWMADLARISILPPTEEAMLSLGWLLLFDHRFLQFLQPEIRLQ